MTFDLPCVLCVLRESQVLPLLFGKLLDSGSTPGMTFFPPIQGLLCVLCVLCGENAAFTGTALLPLLFVSLCVLCVLCGENTAFVENEIASTFA
jgi:hypothetical protein